MDILLTPTEARVLGSLIEKERTTPDYYPLSLNAIQTACNQKSNREPIMDLAETEVMEAIDALMGKHLVREKNPSGSRVNKYAHRLSDSLGLTFGLEKNQLGTLCMLMLRGPQTPGEIRARTARLCEFSSLDDVERTLAELIGHERGPYVTRLPRSPGRKEARFAHLLCGEVDTAELSAADPASADQMMVDGRRIAELAQDIEALRARVEALERHWSLTNEN